MNRSIGEKVTALANARDQIDEPVCHVAGVIGSMIGVKVTKGNPVKKIGVTYLVRIKVPDHDLEDSQRIPKRIKVNGVWFPTDVLVWPMMHEQSAFATSLVTYDGRRPGTLSCFARTADGVFGVSCAHCLVGVDNNPATPTLVEIYQPPNGVKGIAQGRSYWSAFAPGSGRPNNFGYFDCGLIEFDDANVGALIKGAKLLEVVKDVRQLVGQRVFAINAMRASEADKFRRSALILNVDQTALNERADVVLLVDAPGTFGGDSGLLWRTRSGAAVAIHARGEVVLGSRGSRLTTAMAVHRAQSALLLEEMWF